MYNINMLDRWNPIQDKHFSNFLDVERRVLLSLDKCYFLRNIHGLHNIGVLAVVQQNIASERPVSLSTSAAVVPPTGAELFAPRLPHVCLVLK